jgi:hypothetical protein
MIYRFDDSLKLGHLGERFQDAYWGKHYNITAVSFKDDLAGTDRMFAVPGLPVFTFPVQYKYDDKATEFGNLFIETVSNVKTGALGWAQKCAAVKMSIYIPREGLFYMFQVKELIGCARKWFYQYRTRVAYNEGYETRGICVPRDKFVADMRSCETHSGEKTDALTQQRKVV